MVVAVALAGLLALAGDCGSDEDLLRAAAASFQQGLARAAEPDAKDHFRRAADQYALLRRRGHDNADLARNEGNAALLAGDWPRAILAYRHGLRLAPNDAALRAGLAHARSQVKYPAAGDYGRPPAEAWPSWLPRPSSGAWLALAVGAYAATCALFARWRMTRRRWFLQLMLPGYVLTVALAVAVAAEDARRRDAEAHPLVVVAQDGVLLRKGNGAAYPPRRDTPLSRGVEARLLYERGPWLQVQLAGGEVGWLPRKDVLVDTLEPPDSSRLCWHFFAPGSIPECPRAKTGLVPGVHDDPGRPHDVLLVGAGGTPRLLPRQAEAVGP